MVSLKRKRPARKSESVICSVEAANPATSTTAPPPMNTPLGLMRNTRPLDSSCPRMLEDPLPITRLSTAELAPDWMNRVNSSEPIEKPCQLITVPGALVMLRDLPTWLKLAAPATTCAPVGFASTLAPWSDAKHDATVNAANASRRNVGDACLHGRRTATIALTILDSMCFRQKTHKPNHPLIRRMQGGLDPKNYPFVMLAREVLPPAAQSHAPHTNSWESGRHNLCASLIPTQSFSHECYRLVD